jgi:hypothetical protein
LMGLRGERGAAALTIRAWEIDRTRYVATPAHERWLKRSAAGAARVV